MVPEEAIRQRSYEIWLNEGKPEGRAVEHWLRAARELEEELQPQASRIRPHRAAPVVMARIPISRPPQRTIAVRVVRTDTPAAIAARQ